MINVKANIIAQLKKELLPLQGYKGMARSDALDEKLGNLKNAFPGNCFPLAAIHEFVLNDNMNAAASNGFIAALLAPLIKTETSVLWICNEQPIFPVALHSFGIYPQKIIFVKVNSSKEILWVLEEALKCTGLKAVVANVKELSFTASRRLQLAVEQSQVSGFIINNGTSGLGISAAIARWKISSLPSFIEAGLPGVGLARWNVELLKVRNGQPSQWDVTLCEGKFLQIPLIKLDEFRHKKTG